MSKSTPENPDLPKLKKSRTSSTPSESAVGGLLEAFGPLLEFHKAVVDASDNDLRMYWDVRILRGSGETFITSSGSSSFPDALGPKQRANAAITIQQEVHDKIAVPLVGKMQAAVETGALEGATNTRKAKMLSNTAPPKPSGDAMMNEADAIEA
jgi:hypothetical protein